MDHMTFTNLLQIVCTCKLNRIIFSVNIYYAQGSKDILMTFDFVVYLVTKRHLIIFICYRERVT